MRDISSQAYHDIGNSTCEGYFKTLEPKDKKELNITDKHIMAEGKFYWEGDSRTCL